MSKLQPHLKIKRGDIGPLVLLPGDPGRVETVGEFLKGAKVVSQNREFKTLVGNYNDSRITVTSTGIGCPSTAIAVEELIQAGAKYLIRIGTCGGAWTKDIPLGSLIIPTACVRDEGTTKEYVDLEFPAVADFEVTHRLKETAEKLGYKNYLGINRTHDAFYGRSASVLRWGKTFTSTPIISSEMECSALFVIAALKRVKAGAILAVNANPEDKKTKAQVEKSLKDSERVTKKMIKTALTAAEIIIKEEKRCN